MSIVFSSVKYCVAVALLVPCNSTACMLFVFYRWAIVKDKVIYQRMSTYLTLNAMGVSRDSQLRTLKLLKAVLEGGGREIFEFGHETMKKRWEKLNRAISLSKRFSLQEIVPKYCTYFQKIRGVSPGNSKPDGKCFENRPFTLCSIYITMSKIASTISNTL